MQVVAAACVAMPAIAAWRGGTAAWVANDFRICSRRWRFASVLQVPIPHDAHDGSSRRATLSRFEGMRSSRNVATSPYPMFKSRRTLGSDPSATSLETAGTPRSTNRMPAAFTGSLQPKHRIRGRRRRQRAPSGVKLASLPCVDKVCNWHIARSIVVFFSIFVFLVCLVVAVAALWRDARPDLAVVLGCLVLTLALTRLAAVAWFNTFHWRLPTVLSVIAALIYIASIVFVQVSPRADSAVFGL